jgi:cytoskeletal protein RodZ
VTNRRKPTQRSTKSDWKPGRAPGEMAKAVGGAVGVVLVTALVIFVIKPGDVNTSNPSTPAVTTPTVPTGDTTATVPTGDTTATQPTTGTTTTPATTPTSQP